MEDILNNLTDLNEAQLVELNSAIVGHIKFLRTAKSRAMKRQLFIGSKVSFEDNDGQTVQGKIIKVMRKFAQVRTTEGDMCVWRVPLNHLTKVTA